MAVFKAQNIFFDYFYEFTKGLQDRIALIYDEIEDAVEQVVRVPLPHARVLFSQAQAQRLKGVNIAFGKTDNKILSDKNRNLFDPDP